MNDFNKSAEESMNEMLKDAANVRMDGPTEMKIAWAKVAANELKEKNDQRLHVATQLLSGMLANDSYTRFYSPAGLMHRAIDAADILIKEIYK